MVCMEIRQDEALIYARANVWQNIQSWRMVGRLFGAKGRLWGKNNKGRGREVKKKRLECKGVDLGFWSY